MDAHPVTVLTDRARLDAVLAGVRRAGGVVPHAVAWTGPDGLRPALEGREVVVVSCAPAEIPAALQALIEAGARPIPALVIDGDEAAPRVSPASTSLLADPALKDLEIPVPAVDDDDVRRRLWDQLRSVGAEERHHLVEVDGGPAGGWASRAAGAAGVLAGRRVASNRRWRAELDG